MNAGVAVSHSFQLNEKPCDISCSGIYLTKELILTHGVIIDDLIKSDDAAPLRQVLQSKKYIQADDDISKVLFKNYNSKFTAYLPQQHLVKSNDLKEKEIDLPTSRKLSSGSFLGKISTNSSCKILTYEAEISVLFCDKYFQNDIKKLMPANDGWELGTATDNLNNHDTLAISTFILLKLCDNKSTDHYQAINELKQYLMLDQRLTHEPIKGTAVMIESTPFGNLSPEVFLNSLSEGIVSNISGTLLMTDARCILGSEGAPVYCSYRNRIRICGLVVFPFSTKSGEWVGLTIFISAIHLMNTLTDILFDICQIYQLKRLKSPENLINSIDINEKQKNLSNINYDPIKNGSKIIKWHNNSALNSTVCRIEQSVVRICRGSKWGTGFIISCFPGLVLTCAHVTGYEGENVDVILYDGSKLKGKVLYETWPINLKKGSPTDDCEGSDIWDVAVILIPDLTLPAIRLTSTLPTRGTPVYIMGHGIFSNERLAVPSVTRGVVSKIITVPRSSLKCNKIIDLKDPVYSHTPVMSHDMICNEASASAAPTNKINQKKVVHQNEDNVPIMMQTTCSVYPGYSGAPIVSLNSNKEVEVLGMLVCNTRDEVNKASFPNINLAIPAVELQRILSRFVCTRDSEVLKLLSVSSTSAKRLWRLGQAPISKL